MGNSRLSKSKELFLGLSNISKIVPISLDNFFFRIVSQKHEKHILSTEGSRISGGRYNNPGIDGILYLGESKEVCTAEIKRKDPLFSLKYIIGKVEVKLDKVLDLGREENLKILGIKKEDLIKGEKAGEYKVTREIGREAYKKGYEALLVPSITGKGNNLVVFIPNLKEKSERVKLIKTSQVK
ncbi:MAG: hypothetical protein COZ65_01570 [Caldiserica bacterium CG_4_8_14_3_um_filter_35_18]|nr:RES family NAD+ phosphorylase [Caldisericota bacterium]NCQ53522.1 RES family NAD+ phosphorylase [Caldisericota bacterium]PIX29578.1 MAG: hypothetical protein COZ65_01570 [Caldiserica bacterium CG_4_8_14_3_um_filter_35_18]